MMKDVSCSVELVGASKGTLCKKLFLYKSLNYDYIILSNNIVF